MSKLVNIATGWMRRGLKKMDLLPEELTQMSEFRLAHCDSCLLNVDGVCDPEKTGITVKSLKVVNGCDCNLAAKSLVEDEHCPLEKW